MFHEAKRAKMQLCHLEVQILTIKLCLWKNIEHTVFKTPQALLLHDDSSHFDALVNSALS